MDKIKTYKKLPIPEDSSWDRKTYNPYTLFRWWLHDKIRYTWFYSVLEKFIFDPIHNCDNGFRNLYRWFKPVWNDRHWDHHYIFEILKQKLILQREYLISNNRHMGIGQTNRDITICLNLIERLNEGYYETEYHDYMKQKFNFIPTGNKFEGEDTFEMVSETLYKDLVPYFKKYTNQYNKLLKNGYRDRKFTKEDDEIIALYLSQYNHERCHNLLFKILNEKINHWWD